VALDFPSSPTNGQEYEGYVYDTAKGAWLHFDYLSGVSLLGTIFGWPRETIPSWALEANGAAVSRTTYSGLFALYGTTFGAGDGTTTFNLPDYRGDTLVGKAASGTFGTLGATVGSETHSHTLSDAGAAKLQMISGFAYVDRVAGFPSWNSDRRIAAETSDNVTASTTGTGLMGATDTGSSIQPSVVVKWIICATTSTGDFNTEVQTALVTKVSNTPLSQNFILNGAFDIWQRGTSFFGSGVYCADRWIQTRSANVTFTVDRSTDVPAGQPLQYSALLAVALTNTLAQLEQRIESANAQELAGQVVTFSIWAKNDLGVASNSTLTWTSDYPTTTDDWTTPISDQSGTFAATFTLGTWVRYSATFTVNALATRGYRILVKRTQAVAEDTLTYLTGAQLELGSSVTPFRRNAPSIQAELAACQRYYYRITSSEESDGFGMGLMTNATNASSSVPFPVTMRIVPAFASSAASTFQVADGVSTYTPSAIAVANALTRFNGFVNATIATSAGGRGVLLRSSASGATTAFLGFEAEL
jgi:microcystin-dependent protein